MDDPAKFVSELSERLSGLNGAQAVIDQAKEAAMNKLLKMGLKFGAKQVVKKIPGVGWVWQLVTIADDIDQIKYMKYLFDAAEAEAKRLTEEVTNVRKDLLDLLDKLKNGKFKEASAKVADWQRDAATLNDCTRARKCMLVPMKDTDDQSGHTAKTKPDKKLKNNKGCCPGQTGHHLIPDVFFKKAGATGCSKYNYKKAPVVYAEGIGQTHGSHGAAHQAMNRASKRDMDKDTETLNYDDARDAAVESHIKAFPFSLCSPDCIRSQIDKYHKDKKGANCSNSDKLKYKLIGPEDNNYISG